MVNMIGASLSEQSEQKQASLQSLAFLLSICICAAVAAWCIFSYPAAGGSSEKIVLDNKINPNADTAVSMARLPSLGAVKAKAIWEHRQNGTIYKNADDLDNVKGIGPKTVENVRPYLKFE
jgi:competence ComEA-like helix-hairpin-helix protein